VNNSNSTLGSLGTSNFCLDFWFNWRNYGNGNGSFGQIGDFNYGSCGARSGTSNAQYLYFGSSYDGNVVSSYAGQVGNNTVNPANLNQWYHYMIIRQSGIFYVFLDGVLKIVNTSDTSNNIANGGGWAFGSYYRNDSPHYWDVNFSDVMFTRDSDCQYSLNNATSGDINSTFFTTPRYKNKTMASSSISKFSISKKPTTF
jgi:hypothetical protein